MVMFTYKRWLITRGSNSTRLLNGKLFGVLDKWLLMGAVVTYAHVGSTVIL